MKESSVVLEIVDPMTDSLDKLLKAMEAYSKLTGMSVDFDIEHSGVEPTPYTALRDLADVTYQGVSNGLLHLFEQISQKWLHLEVRKSDSDPFTLKGKMYLNPKTGRPLTIGEWKKIQDYLTRYLSHLYGQSQDTLVKVALATGKLLQQMDPDARITVPFNDLEIPVISTRDAQVRRILDYATVRTGEMLQEVTARSRRAIVDVIMSGYEKKATSRQMQQDLFDKLAMLNKDWRRIAETETANNFNNGYLMAENETRRGNEHVFMLGITGARACDWCTHHVSHQVVVLLDDAPASGGDQVQIDGETFTAIWPGKSNFGRSRADWWVAAGTQHPHCRCTWTRYDMSIREYEQKLRSAASS